MKLRLATAAALLLLPAADPGAAPAGPAADLAPFRGPNRDGSFPGALPHRRPRAVWTFPTGGPVHGSPIWLDGMVIVGSGDGNLYALDGTSGRERWKFHTGGPIDGPAAYAAGNLVFESRDGNLYAVEPRAGLLRWKLALGPDLPFKWGWDFFLSGPAADARGGRVFAGSGSGEVLAVDAASGSVAWRYRTEGRVRSSPTVDAGVVYVGSSDGHLYALDAESGALRWKFATAGVTIDLEKAGFDRRSVQSSPAVTADLVVVGCRDGHLYGVDRATGKERWNFDHQVSWVVGSPAIAGDRAIVGSSDGRFVQAVELATGRELWRSRTDSNALSSPARAGDVAVVGDASGALLAYDVATGTELWRFRTGESIHSSPLVRSGRIYVGSDDGKVYALAGDVSEPPAHRALRAVYFDPRAPYRPFEGDREIRDALTDASFRWLTRRELPEFLAARAADRAPSVVVFATAAVPTSIVEPDGSQPALVRRYLDAGGKIVWLAEVPFLFTFDPAKNEMVQPKREDLVRSRALFGVDPDNLGEGECRAEVTEAGRRWGISPGWWLGQAPLASDQPGVEALARDEHGHVAAFAKRFGGPEGTGFVFYWGRERAIPDPDVVRKLAEHGLP